MDKTGTKIAPPSAALDEILPIGTATTAGSAGSDLKKLSACFGSSLFCLIHPISLLLILTSYHLAPPPTWVSPINVVISPPANSSIGSALSSGVA